MDFTFSDVVGLDVKLVRSHGKYHLFDGSENDALLDEFDLLRRQVTALLLVSIVGQLLILQLLLLFEELGLLGNHDGGSLVVSPLSSAPMVFLFYGGALIVFSHVRLFISQLCLEGFLGRLFNHLILSLFVSEVFGRGVLDEDLMFVEEAAVSKDDLFGQELPDPCNIPLELHAWVFL